MKQKISTLMGSDLNAQQDFAVSVKLIIATEDSVFFWSQGKPVANIVETKVRQHG